MPRKPAPPDVSFLAGPALSSPVFARGASDVAAAREIALDLLDDNPFQPRERVDPEQLAQLTEVIGAQGFQGVLVARLHPTRPGRYQLAFGHRRRNAAREAGLSTVPVQVRDLADRDMVEMAITENIQREDLTPLAEGRTYLLMKQQLGYTQEQIAAAIGKTRGYVVDRLRLAQAPEDVQAFLEEKPDSIRAAATLVQIADPAVRAELMDGMRAGRLTINDLPQYRRLTPEETLAEEPGVAPEADPIRPDDPAIWTERTVPVEPRARPAAPEAPPDTRALERAARLRLATAWESLTKYEQQAAERGEISLAEFTKLAELRALVERLYTMYSPEPINTNVDLTTMAHAGTEPDVPEGRQGRRPAGTREDATTQERPVTGRRRSRAAQ